MSKRKTLIALFAPMILLNTQAQAQGAGATGAQVLQFPAGSRAAGFSGAYAGATGDADVLFYNPAGAASLRLGAALAFETLVEDMTLSSLAGAVRVGKFTLGVSGLFLDAGEIAEVVPDPDFGGSTGRPTGLNVSASEAVARFGIALPVNDRLRLGAAAGFTSSSIANLSSSAPMFDLGAQYDLSFGTIGLAVRNLGGALSAGGLEDAELPTEARLGTALQFARADGLGVTIHSDLIARLRESSTGLLFGAEAGYLPSAIRSFGAVARIGFSAADGADALAPLRLGAGVSLSNLALDYTYQSFDFFGATHRFGLRWSVAR